MTGQRKALIIANDEYEQEALRNLLAPEADAEALGRVLGDPQIGDFAVQVARNEPAYVIQAQIEELFSESRPDDLLLLHFSGHGLKSEAGELFFAASNTRPDRLRATAVSAGFVQQCMHDARSRSVVLLLDCCYGGAFAEGVVVRAARDVNVLDSFSQAKSGGGRGRAVITASNAMEYAFEGDRLADDQRRRPSVFTGALVEGLATGDADRDEDGWVSLDELYEYVFDKVREQNPHQTPSRQVELQGELYLARSRRRRIRPAPIPPDLQAAITDQNMYTRRGAVQELQSRLASDDLSVAAGAYEALAELARTDIRYVADVAAPALGHVAIRPEETELHFGKLRQGSDPPHRMVRLLGPPIAHACAPRVSSDWIHVNETAEGLNISVDTAGTGTLRGGVDLKGPTGEATIAVDVELLARAAVVNPDTGREPESSRSKTAQADQQDMPTQTMQGGSGTRDGRANAPERSRQGLKDTSEPGTGDTTEPESGGSRIPRPGVLIAAVVAVIVLLATGLGVFLTRGGPGPAPRGAAPAQPKGPYAILRDTSSKGLLAVVFTSGSVLAAGDDNGSIYLWDVATGNLTATLHDPGGEGINDVAFSQSGDLVAAADTNGSVYLWDVATGNLTATLHDPGSKGVYGVKFSPEGVLAAADDNGSIYLWDAATGKLITTLNDPGSKGVYEVAFSPDGFLAAGDKKGAIYLWDVATGKLITTLNDPGGEGIYYVAFGPGGGYLAAVDDNGSDYLWDVATGKLTATLYDPGSKGNADIAFSPKGGHLAAADSNGSVYLWDVATGKLTATLHDPGSKAAVGIAFNPDGSSLAVGDSNGSNYLWHMGWLSS